MPVVVQLPAVLRPLAKDNEHLEISGADSVGDVFAVLGEEYPALRRRLTDDQGALRRHVNVFLGDDNIRDLSDLRTPVSDGDVLLVLPSISGG